MAIALTIAGATKFPKVDSVSIYQTANGRSTASFDIVSLDGSYRPALDAEVIITEGATRVFGGLIDRPRERGAADGSSTAIVTEVTAVDFNAYTDRRLVVETIPSGNLKAALTVLVTYLSSYGVTLDAGQVNGPTLPDLVYDYRSLTEVLNELMTLTADAGEPYVWRIDAFKVLSAYQPSTAAAPFDLIGEAIPEVIGDIAVESERASTYANRVIVKVPTKNEFGHTESFVGDGVTTTFNVQYDVLKHYGHMLVASGGGETLGTPEGGGGGQWSYDATTKTVTRTAGATAPGETYTFYFDGAYSGLGIAEDAGEIASIGLYEKIVVVESVPSDTTAQAIADAYLARSLPTMRTIRYRTLETGIAPGQTQTVTISRRNISATAVISDIVIRDLALHGLGNVFVREVTAVIDASQTNLGRGWRDVYKVWNGDKLGNGAAVATTTVATGSGPGSGAESARYVLKTGDTSRSSTTPTDDPHLTFSAAANTYYKVEIWLILESISNNNDWKIGVSVPAGATFQWGAESDQSPNWGPLPLAGTPVVLAAAAGTIGTGGNGSGITGAVFKGVLKTSGTAGAFTLQWSQNTAAIGGNSTVKTGSFIEYAKLAA